MIRNNLGSRRTAGLILISTLTSTLVCALAPDAWAIYSFQTTLSSGYYRDLEQKPHLPVFFYWNFDHTAQNSTETYADLGVNNNLVPGIWKFSLYQAYVTVPLGGNSELSVYRRPQATVGRQMLTEGFDLALMDGAQIPYSWSESGGVFLYGGALRNLEDRNLENGTRVYGASLRGKAARTKYRMGYERKESNTDSLNLAHATAMREWTEIPGQPTALAKGQWNLSTGRFDQALGELQVTPAENLQAALDYSSRRPTPFDAANGLFIYRLFALSTEEQLSANLTWRLSPEVTAQGGVDHVRYQSPAGRETSYQETLGLSFDRDRNRWSPNLVHLKSYGGELIQMGIRLLRTVTSFTQMRIEADVAYIDKINGISGWAYHTRGGMSFHLGSRFLAMALVEIERNQIFKIDARGVIYVSHFYY